jgi:hypothetical protein
MALPTDHRRSSIKGSQTKMKDLTADSPQYDLPDLRGGHRQSQTLFLPFSFHLSAIFLWYGPKDLGA